MNKKTLRRIGYVLVTPPIILGVVMLLVTLTNSNFNSPFNNVFFFLLGGGWIPNAFIYGAVPNMILYLVLVIIGTIFLYKGDAFK